MALRYAVGIILIAHAIFSSSALPTSLVEEIKANEKRSDKSISAVPKPFLNDDQPATTDWDQDPPSFRNKNKNNALPNTASNAYNSPENVYDDKTIADYEKGFRYGSNKDQLDEAIENAVLKSEMYGEPGGVMNQYRLENRMKREVDLTPEEVLALLSLYERRHRPNENYRYPWNRAENDIDFNYIPDEARDDEENWLDNPVMPHATTFNRELGPKYLYDQGNRQLFDNKERWGAFDSAGRNKRFMVSRKRSIDPTRELRYINGPNRNNFYTLSQLLGNQRDPNIPVVQRLVL